MTTPVGGEFLNLTDLRLLADPLFLLQECERDWLSRDNVTVRMGATVPHALEFGPWQFAIHTFILYYRDGAPKMFDTAIGMCKREKFSPRIIDSPEFMQTVLTMIESGQGVSLVPACVRLLRPNGVTFHKLDDATLLDLVKGCSAR